MIADGPSTDDPLCPTPSPLACDVAAATDAGEGVMKVDATVAVAATVAGAVSVSAAVAGGATPTPARDEVGGCRKSRLDATKRGPRKVAVRRAGDDVGSGGRGPRRETRRGEVPTEKERAATASSRLSVVEGPVARRTARHALSSAADVMGEFLLTLVGGR